MVKVGKDEYYFLTEKLEEINFALEGSCNDVDCDKYTYRSLLKKRYKPVLKHSFSCIKSLNRQKSAVMRLLSLQKFKKFRFENCIVCRRKLDKLSENSAIASFTRPASKNGFREWKGEHVHKKCLHRVIVPKGWKKGF